jgi:hypothetical protein
LEVEEQRAGQPSIYTLRHGTLILEPEPGPPEGRSGRSDVGDGSSYSLAWARSSPAGMRV